MASYDASGPSRTCRAGCRQKLDLRFPQAPFCYCCKKTHLRVVGSSWKASYGKIYFCCFDGGCRYFAWANPITSTWQHNGVQVQPPIRDGFGEFNVQQGNTGEWDFEDTVEEEGEREVDSTHSKPRDVNRNELKIGNVEKNDGWKITFASLLVLFIVVILFK